MLAHNANLNTQTSLPISARRVDHNSGLTVALTLCNMIGKPSPRITLYDRDGD